MTANANVKSNRLTPEQKQANKEARQKAREEAKEAARIEAEKSQKPVKEMVITIEWVKSRTWGSNPKAEAEIRFKDGSFQRSAPATASGCGYDKESTVIAELFNRYMKYKLWGKEPEQLKRQDYQWKEKNGAPYGINSYQNAKFRSFAGGIGTNCYYAISEYLGGKFEHVASGKTFDVYKYTDL
jgi:hypothetical protein